MKHIHIYIRSIYIYVFIYIYIYMYLFIYIYMSWIFFWTYSASCYRLTFAKQPLQVWYSLNCQLPAFQDRQDTRNNLTDAAGSPSLKVIAPKKCANYVSCCLRCGKLMLASYMPVIYIHILYTVCIYAYIILYCWTISKKFRRQINFQRAEPWRVLDDRNVSVYMPWILPSATQFKKTVN